MYVMDILIDRAIKELNGYCLVTMFPLKLIGNCFTSRFLKRPFLALRIVKF